MIHTHICILPWLGIVVPGSLLYNKRLSSLLCRGHTYLFNFLVFQSVLWIRIRIVLRDPVLSPDPCFCLIVLNSFCEL
jgi:hypothetical protein